MTWRALWLATEFRKAGLTVVEVAGWQTRGDPYPRAPAGGVSVYHHTASNRGGGPAAGLNIVVHGRPGLQGPIANFLTARNGVIYIVASGVSNNAGRGNGRVLGLPNVAGNANTIANEMENDGVGEPYAAVQRTAAMRAHAAVHRRMGWPAGRAIAHWEWSTAGKIDPTVRTWGSMTGTRKALATFIAGEPPEAPDMLKDEHDMLKDGHDAILAIHGMLLNATSPTGNDTVEGGRPRVQMYRVIYELASTVAANAASVETRDAAVLALLRAGSGNADTAAILAAISAEAEETRVAVLTRADERLREIGAAIGDAGTP